MRVNEDIKLPEGHMAAGCGWGHFSDQTVQREWVCKEGAAAVDDDESVVESETEVGMAQTGQI